MSSTRKKLLRSPAVVSVGCSCRRPWLAQAFLRRRPEKSTPVSSKVEQSYHQWSPWDSRDEFTTSVPTTTATTSTTTTSMSPACSEAAGPSQGWAAVGSAKIGESLAVVKDSDDPYVDFRQSMLQMILEKEIYAKEDLRELLHCFLSLNSPYHHEIIIRAFMEIWNGAHSAAPLARPPVASRRRRRTGELRGVAHGRHTRDM